MSQYKISEIIFNSSQSTNEDKDKPRFTVGSVSNVVGYSFSYLVVPFSYYIIDHSNNSLFLHQSATYNNETVWFVFELLLKPGTYSADNFTNEWTRAVTETSTRNYYYFVNGVKTYGTVPTTLNGASNPPKYVDDRDKFKFFVETEAGRSVFYHTTREFKIEFKNCFEVFGHSDSSEKSSVNTALWRDGVKVEAGAAIHVLRSPKVVRFIGPTTLTLHSTLPFTNSVRDPQGSREFALRVPVSGNFGSYMTFAGNGEMIPCSGSSLSDLWFWLTLGDKKDYYVYDSAFAVQAPKQKLDYLPLNGEEFTVALKIYEDTGLTSTQAM